MADPGGFSVDPSVLANRLADSFGDFFRNIGNLAVTAGNTATGADEILTDIGQIIDDWTELKDNLAEEVQKLKDFEFNPHWKTRVINVPIATDQIRDLIDEIFHQVKDRLESIIQPLTDTIHDFKLLQVSEENIAGDQPSKFVQKVSKAEDIIIFLKSALSHTREAFDSAKDVTELFLDITTRIEKLEDVFLQQKNKRHRVTVKVRERLGKLHSGTAA